MWLVLYISKIYRFNEEIIKLKSQNKLLSAENSYYKHIINELEKYLNKLIDCSSVSIEATETYEDVLDKLKELKENNK